jgi:hypothetical protein
VYKSPEMCLGLLEPKPYKMYHGHPAGVAVAVCALLTCSILSGHTSLLPNKSWPGSIRLYDPHDSKLLVIIAVYISRRRGGGPVAALQTYAPRCPTDLERFFARPARRAGCFQHSPGEFHAKNFPVLPPGLAGVTFDTGTP